MEKVIYLEDVAELCGIKPATVHNYMREGILPYPTNHKAARNVKKYWLAKNVNKYLHLVEEYQKENKIRGPRPKTIELTSKTDPWADANKAFDLSVRAKAQ